jgi:hypothetical protein
MDSSGCNLGQRSVLDVVTKYNDDETLDIVRLGGESIPEISVPWRCLSALQRDSDVVSHHIANVYGREHS